MAQVQCPHCKSNNVSKTVKGNVVQTAASFGGGFVEGVVKESANELLFEGAGKFVPKFGNKLASYAPIEYVCNSCDCLFNAVVTTDGDAKNTTVKKLPMPEEIIGTVRLNYIQSIKKKRPYASTAIFALITLYCIVCMLIGVADNNGVQIVLSFVLAIPFLIPAIFKFKKISALNHEIEECNIQSPREFKIAHRDLFRAYTQYN